MLCRPSVCPDFSFKSSTDNEKAKREKDPEPVIEIDFARPPPAPPSNAFNLKSDDVVGDVLIEKFSSESKTDVIGPAVLLALGDQTNDFGIFSDSEIIDSPGAFTIDDDTSI